MKCQELKEIKKQKKEVNFVLASLIICIILTVPVLIFSNYDWYQTASKMPMPTRKHILEVLYNLMGFVALITFVRLISAYRRWKKQLDKEEKECQEWGEDND